MPNINDAQSSVSEHSEKQDDKDHAMDKAAILRATDTEMIANFSELTEFKLLKMLVPD